MADSNKHRSTSDGMVRFALLLGIAIAARAWQFGNPVLHVDDQFYLLVGDRIWAGALPYVDIWDRKPVGLFLVYAAIRALPGDGVLAYQLAATVFAAATAWVVVSLADRVASRGAALVAGAAYLFWLGAFGGDGGQSPVFYNLLIALAALLVVRVAEGAPLFRYGCGAMALVGVAMQVKYTAVFEGVFFGLALVWYRPSPFASSEVEKRSVYQRISTSVQRTEVYPERLPWQAVEGLDTNGLGMITAWIGIALLPTALAWGWYAAIGHGGAFAFANFTSIFGRSGDGAGASALRLLTMAAKLSPLLLAAVLARRQGPATRLLAGWATAAIAGVMLFGTYWDHYALPLLAPLCVLAAATLTKWRGALGAVVLIAGAAQSANAIVKHRHQRGDGVVAREIAVFAKPRLRGGCLFVFDGDPWLYAMAGSCLPTTRPFPDHLDNFRENDATGIDTGAEIRRIMATRPPVVIVSAAPEPKTNAATRRIVHDALVRDYYPARRWPVGTRIRVAFVRRD